MAVDKQGDTVYRLREALIKIKYIRTWPRGAAARCVEIATEALDLEENPD